MKDKYWTTEELQEKWRVKNVRTVRRMLRRHADVLKPMRIAKRLLVSDENRMKFEAQQYEFDDNLD
jgi:hypothetical protein